MIVSIIGMGSIGQRHFNNLILFKKKYKKKEIRGYEFNQSKIKILKKKYKNFEITNDFKRAVINSDIVYICNPTNLHNQSILNTLKYSKPHFYIEKPLSSKIDGCKFVLNKIKKTKKTVAIGYMLRNHPVILYTKKLLEKKILGKILFARAESGFYLPFWHPWENYKDFYMSSIKKGGGALLDTSHEINYLQYFFGKAISVSGKVKTISDLEITSDDLTTADILFEKNIKTQIHLDLLQFDEERYFKIIASEAVLIGDLKNNFIKIYNKKSKKWKIKKFNFKFDKIYHTQLLNFMRKINRKKSNICDSNSAFETMKIIEAIRKSSKSNSQVIKI